MIIVGDARHLPIGTGTVQCVVTSPPYWKLRDYGAGNQIGDEPTPDEYVQVIVAVFQEIRRALKDDGTAWLNLGDSYINDHTKENRLKPKDLVGIPWRVALALQADGWWLRSDIIWSKPNPMPESVKDRPTRSHEYIFLLTKSEKYYYDADAIKEPVTYTGPSGATRSPYGQGFTRRSQQPTPAGWDTSVGEGGHGAIHRNGRRGTDKQRGHGRRHAGFNDRWEARPKDEHCGVTRNKRSVWHIATRPYPGAHYATFPSDIPKICIQAGSRPGDVILDPFAGTGTTGKVAIELGRKAVCLDLSSGYAHGHMRKRMATTMGLPL